MKLYKTAGGTLYLVTANNHAHKQIREPKNPYGPPVYWIEDAADAHPAGDEIGPEAIIGIDDDGANIYKSFAVIPPNFWRYDAAEIVTRSGYHKLIIEGQAEEGLDKGRAFCEIKTIDPAEIDVTSRWFAINEMQAAAVLDHWRHTGKSINYPQDIDLYCEKNGELNWFEINLF